MATSVTFLQDKCSEHEISTILKRPMIQEMDHTSNSLPKHQTFNVKQPTITLNDSNKIPILGLGTWNAQGDELKNAVKRAICMGYRHLDTAANYKNEKVIGEAIMECINDGVVSRQDLYITTKVWNNSHSRASIPVAIKTSLENLKLSYVDLYLIHYPIGYKEGCELSPVDETGSVITSDIDYVETWLGMQDAYRSGATRSIGVSNFSKSQLKRLINNCSIVPAMNQIECHPYLTQKSLIEFCKRHSIEITAYSPLGSPARQLTNPSAPLLIEDPIVKSIAKKYGMNSSQVLIKYHMQRGIVVIPKAVDERHLQENLEAINMRQLSNQDLKELDLLDRNYRFMLFERCSNHKYYPFKEDDQDSIGSDLDTNNNVAFVNEIKEKANN